MELIKAKVVTVEAQAVVVMEKINEEAAGIPHEFTLKHIENEINAGFLFVAAARRAFKRGRPGEAADALEEAAKKRQTLLKEVSASPAVQVRAVIHQLSELREAIDWLRTTAS